jgi:hypothetical protein
MWFYPQVAIKLVILFECDRRLFVERVYFVHCENEIGWSTSCVKTGDCVIDFDALKHVAYEGSHLTIVYIGVVETLYVECQCNGWTRISSCAYVP